MAYAYTLALPAAPLAHDFSAILHRFEQRLRSNWPEDFAVSADTSEWDVAFSNATSGQQA